jgi:glycosyltransferase involved in cell wall biosynthesis
MENFWIELAEMGRSRGLRPLIVYPTSGTVPAAIRDAGIETMVRPIGRTGGGRLLDALALVKSRSVRCVYLTDRPFSAAGYALLRLAGVRVLINHDHTPGDRPPIRGLRGAMKAAWRRLPMTGCDLQLCVSPLVAERAVENARIPADRVAVVQNGIVPVDCTGDRTYAHRVLGIPPRARICVTVARASTYKRIDFVLDVARRARAVEDLADFHFVHVGDGPELEALRGASQAAGLGDRLHFAGRRSDVRQILCSADVALHPAKGEAFSLAILEYMSAGLAVLVPDIPTVRQAVDPDRTGLVYPDGDVEAVLGMLRRLAASDDLRSRLGRAAATEVQVRFSLAAMNAAFRAAVGPAMDRAGIPLAP